MRAAGLLLRSICATPLLPPQPHRYCATRHVCQRKLRTSVPQTHCKAQISTMMLQPGTLHMKCSSAMSQVVAPKDRDVRS